MDGEHALGFYWGPWTDAGEVEEQDERLPHLILSRKLDRNFHGFGKYRGGTPLLEVAIGCGEADCAMSSWGSCDKLSFNYGLFGGYAGPPNPRLVIRDNDLAERVRAGEDLELGQYALLAGKRLGGDYVVTSSSKDAEGFGENDLVVHSVGAGGGYGDVLERDPGLVLADLADGLITREVAERIYGVVLDEDGARADEEATARIRARIRKQRLSKGRTFGEFIRDWKKKRPPEAVLEKYGHWPEPRLEAYDEPFWGLYCNGGAGRG